MGCAMTWILSKSITLGLGDGAAPLSLAAGLALGLLPGSMAVASTPGRFGRTIGLATGSGGSSIWGSRPASPSDGEGWGVLVGSGLAPPGAGLLLASKSDDWPEVLGSGTLPAGAGAVVLVMQAAILVEPRFAVVKPSPHGVHDLALLKSLV